MTGRDRLLVSGLAVFVALAGFWFAVLGPKRSEAAKLDGEVAAVQLELDEATRLSAAAEAAQRSYGEDSAAVAALGKALPADDQTASLLYQLDAAAGRSNIKLKSISPTAPGAPTVPGATAAALPAGVTEMALSLSFEGRFADLQRFLRRVHSYTSVSGERISVQGRMLNVRGFQLTSDEDGRVEATVTASAYIAGPPTAPPAAGAPAPGASAQAAPPAGASAPVAPPTQTAMVGVGG